MRMIVLKNATIIDGTGRDPMPNGSVIIEGERIKEVLAAPPSTVPHDAISIDCCRQTLLPGLIDAHIHAGAIDADLAELNRRNYQSILILGAAKILKETLEQGFTSARDAGGADPGLRIAIEQGICPGPRLSVSGCCLSMTGGHGDVRYPTDVRPPGEDVVGFATRVCDGVDEVRRAAREQLRQGVDHVKVMAGGGAASPGDEPDGSQYSLEELKAIVFEAESAGKYVLAHVYSSRAIHLCLEAGVRSFEHGNLLDEESARALKDAGAFLVPTMATYEMNARMGERLGLPEFFRRKSLRLRDRSAEAVKIASQVGVKIASGSDLLGPMQRHKGLELELKANVLGPMGAIVSATKTNAELLCKETDLGTIEPGKLADLILVNGDPIKDIKILQQYEEKLSLIMQGGKFFKNILPS